MSGHSKWSTIKRKKGAADAKRGKVFTKVIKELTVAAKLGGGDPDGNPRLRSAIALAKSCNMPNDNITRAIKKGTGELEGITYDELLYEGVGPAGILFIVEVMTDNRNRTAAEVRKMFSKSGGELGASGSATWAFDHKGVLRIAADAATEDELFEVAVGAGAEDLEIVDDQWMITTARDGLEPVREALESAGHENVEAKLERIPKNPKEVDISAGKKLLNLFECLDDHDDVQNVFTDFELSDESLAALEES